MNNYHDVESESMNLIRLIGTEEKMRNFSEKECPHYYKYVLPLFDANVSISAGISSSSCKAFTVSIRNMCPIFAHSILFGKTKVYQINLKII